MSTADQSGAPAQLAAALAGRYAIERQIGEGGMASVYLAREFKHNRHVALKVLHPELGAVLGKERFLAEIQLTANLQHPHILPLFDSGEAEGLLYYTMPYIEGESLRALLERERQLPVADALRIATAAAGALEHAHRRGVIHRDLKPENILLADGQPIVADFGIALAISRAGGARITQSGLSLGTPQYMSPEQATGDRQLDARTDVYSLGAVVYEMLTGEPPHTGSTAQAVIARLVTETPRAIRGSRPSVPAHVESAVLGALEKLPADRFASAAEFAVALEGAHAGYATRPLSPSVNPRPPGPRTRPPLALSVAVAALAIVAGAALWRDWASREPATVPVVRVTLPLTSEPHVGPPAFSDDGRRIAYVSEDGHRIVLRSLDSEEGELLAGTDDAFWLSFSPGGDYIAFVADRQLKRIATVGGVVQSIADSALDGAPAWRAANAVVFSRTGGLYEVPAEGGTPRALTVVDSAAGERVHDHPLVLNEHVLVFRVQQDGRPMHLAAARLPRSGRSPVAHRRLTVPGSRPVAFHDGWLLYENPDATALLAIRFDPRGLTTSGSPVLVLGDGHALTRAAISRSGSLVYVARHGTRRFVYASGGGREDSIPSLAPERVAWRGPMYPAVSPTGRQLAFSAMMDGGRDLWMYDFRTLRLRRLTTRLAALDPQWTPDGRRIVFTSDSGGVRRLWRQDLDGRNERELLINADVFTSTISPDGRTVVYASANRELWQAELGGDPVPQRLFGGEAREMMPRFSPDGRWLAYVADYAEPGTLEVYVVPFPETGPRVQVSSGGGTEPAWAPDGRRIFYRGGGDLMEAIVRTEPQISVVSRGPLFPDEYEGEMNHLNYAITPDGSRFILVRAELSDPRLVLVLNWLGDLRARMSSAKAR